ncbi:ankyrin repeat domain-containing protein [Streptomyces monticola]|uniref:Ankyrin repeat domain-containing protein n=1 Tax=Streptomyces monticola TaxID=2666263 RepID=A0ABW2JLF9_9ACTN
MTNDSRAPATLISAVFEGDDAVARLLRAGADPEGADPDGQTPLYLAAVQDESGIVRMLLAAGADPDRLSSGTDLPLCGAACGGHVEVVRALLAAGAQPDRTEEFGFRALTWAVQLGHARVAEALLEAGADAGLVREGHRPPLVAAAQRGSLDTVRVLLRHGATQLRPALDEARRMLGRDLAADLGRDLAAPGCETAVRRVRAGEGITLVAELYREDGLLSGKEQQTGHGAIATLLEQELGVRAPFGELLDRALPFEDPENENWTESVSELARRGDEATYQAAAALTRSPAIWRRIFAVDVLARLGFGQRSLALIRPLCAAAAQAEPGPGQAELAGSLLLALAHHRDPSTVDTIAAFARHPDAAVRRRVGFALHGLVSAADTAALDALTGLCGDSDAEVREWATTALAYADTDVAPVREALAARLADSDENVAAEAARGLAIREDERARRALIRLVCTADRDGYAFATALEGAAATGDASLRRLAARYGG